MNFWKKMMLFYLGGMSYAGLELLWRGRSHGSMFALGGLCFLALGHLDEVTPQPPLALRLPLGAGIITMLELATGMLVNRQYLVWDYRDLPLNFMGQICLPFTLLWIPVGGAAMWLYPRLERKLDQSSRRSSSTG